MGEEYNNLMDPSPTSLLINPMVSNGMYKNRYCCTLGNNPYVLSLKKIKDKKLIFLPVAATVVAIFSTISPKKRPLCTIKIMSINQAMGE